MKPLSLPWTALTKGGAVILEAIGEGRPVRLSRHGKDLAVMLPVADAPELDDRETVEVTVFVAVDSSGKVGAGITKHSATVSLHLDAGGDDRACRVATVKARVPVPVVDTEPVEVEATVEVSDEQ